MQITDEIVTSFMGAMRREIACWHIEERPSAIIGGKPTWLAHDSKRALISLLDSDDPPPAIVQLTFPDSAHASDAVTRRAIHVGLTAVLGGPENG